MPADINIRTIGGKDDEARAFVGHAAWMTMRDSNWSGPIDVDQRYDIYRGICNSMLDAGIGRVATAVGAPGVFLGFALGEKVALKTETAQVLHLIYVKKAFRGYGIGTKLVNSLDIDYSRKLCYTFRPHGTIGELLKKFHKAKHRPALMRHKFDMSNPIPERKRDDKTSRTTH